jgi:hypothetical protein
MARRIYNTYGSIPNSRMISRFSTAVVPQLQLWHLNRPMSVQSMGWLNLRVSYPLRFFFMQTMTRITQGNSPPSLPLVLLEGPRVKCMLQHSSLVFNDQLVTTESAVHCMTSVDLNTRFVIVKNNNLNVLLHLMVTCTWKTKQLRTYGYVVLNFRPIFLAMVTLNVNLFLICIK